MRRCLLPFYDERRAKIDMIVLHSVAFPSEKAVEVFKECQVSSHYLIGEDGEIWQLVGERHRAWHAGKSKWKGLEDINSRSIGIELCSSSLGQNPFTESQKKSLFLLLQRLVRKYKVSRGNIVGHSDIAPMRKADPGKAFFWKELADIGIGLWYNQNDGKKLQEKNIEELLALIGYDTTEVQAAAYAFCRRYLPQRVADFVRPEEACAVFPDIEFEKDLEFLTVLRAVAYAYGKESNTACKI